MKTPFKNLLGAALSRLVNSRSTRNPAALARTLIVGLAVLAAPPSQAAKHQGGGGSGGGSGGGTIYYLGGAGGPMTSMNSDGSNKTQLGLGLLGSPSHTLHNNHRWFLYELPYADQVYPGGSKRFDLFALRDDYDSVNNNNASTCVQLTDNPLLEPGGWQWLPGDDSISFIGRRWSSTASDATIVEGGIYTATLVFDADGSIVGLAAQPTTPAIPLPLVDTAYGPEPDVAYYSWAPTADEVAYSNYADNGLWIADLLGAGTQISYSQAHMPVWSPAGDVIAFASGYGIYTIKPNGAARKLIVADTSTWLFVHAYFSPDGNQLFFTGESLPDHSNRDIFTANVHGGDLVNLTSTPTIGEVVFEWEGGWVQ